MGLRRYLRRMDRDFWREARAVPWASYRPKVGSEMGPYHSVPGSLRRLAVAKHRWAADSAYDMMLDSVGHNHSGSVYAVLAPATPFLIRIALEGRTWAQVSALEVLIDAVSWLNWTKSRTAIEPDPRDVLRCFEGHRGAFEELVADPGCPRHVRRAAEELLEVLDDAGP